jgi:hypothetical protein
MSHLIYEHVIVFTNNLFIFRTETESSLSEPNRAEFTNNRAYLTPLRMINFSSTDEFRSIDLPWPIFQSAGANLKSGNDNNHP